MKQSIKLTIEDTRIESEQGEGGTLQKKHPIRTVIEKEIQKLPRKNKIIVKVVMEKPLFNNPLPSPACNSPTRYLSGFYDLIRAQRKHILLET